MGILALVTSACSVLRGHKAPATTTSSHPTFLQDRDQDMGQGDGGVRRVDSEWPCLLIPILTPLT